uniref:Uncharacterized protein n=1 Tax=Physcomitrium patens TaxID=3218 RepID=A0A2K1J3L4_PHYPA|nr:hypothetical protein PHYPA_021961 [Physcomitrium patens]
MESRAMYEGQAISAEGETGLRAEATRLKRRSY